MKPHELSRHQAAPHCAEIWLRLEPEQFWFQGHFPVQPLLPGVAQLDWVMQYARQLLGLEGAVERIPAVKFQAPLLPGDEVLLTLNWQADKQLLSFSYQRPAGDRLQPISNGKIRLCP